MSRRGHRPGTLIVGASQAGVQLAVSLRRLGDTEPITLAGEEPCPPYQRPPLSKEFLTGEARFDTLALRAPDFYADSGIDLVSGERVREAAAGVAATASGREIPYDRLALTVGASPRRLPVPGADLDGVCYLRAYDDGVRLRDRLRSATRVVVAGGGFIGLEVAAAAGALGPAVTVVIDRVAESSNVVLTKLAPAPPTPENRSSWVPSGATR